VTVAAVAPRSAAARAGLAPGDRIVAVNGHPLRDAIDFQFHAGDERLALTVERGGATAPRRLERCGADLGIATCANKCVFCFIHQLPKGMRRSLYVKDDDFRLSFLHGNYITLSDLDEASFERIIEQRLSPLYISVHATDPELRHALLGRPRHSAEILPRLERLAKAGIRMHAQIVLCPDLNDGVHLERTVAELAPLHPHVATTAIVPVGLTRHRERLPALRSLTPDEARALVAAADGWQRRGLAELGSRFVFLADEIYLLAGLPLPDARAYEGFPVAEDGIGLVRRFEDGFARSIARRRRPVRGEALTLVTGELFALRLRSLLAGGGYDPATVRVAAVPELGRAVLVPAVAVRDGDGTFLDDLTPADLARDLGVPVRVVQPTPGALLRAIRDS